MWSVENTGTGSVAETDVVLLCIIVNLFCELEHICACANLPVNIKQDVLLVFSLGASIIRLPALIGVIDRFASACSKNPTPQSHSKICLDFICAGTLKRTITSLVSTPVLPD